MLLAKQLTLDTLGTTLAATTLGAGCSEVVDVMSALGGKPESSIIGRGIKVSAPNAAFANGALAHALNYDAFGRETGHTGVACFVAPLAVAEAGAPVSGRRFLTAVAAASEVTARVTLVKGGRNLSPRILAGQFFSYFGAAAGAGQILGLNADEMHSAFGLALMQVSGSRQVVIGGDAPAKAIYGAFPNHGGVLAALLARGGVGAQIDALEGDAGFYALASAGQFDAEALTDGLGTRFAFLNTQFKPWPTSIHVVPFIEASLELAIRYDLKAADIDSIEVVGANLIRDWFEPLSERRRPPNSAAAADSAIFGATKALAHRDVLLADFTPSGLRDEVARSLADRTTYRIDERVHGGVVVVCTKSGQRLEAVVDKPPGLGAEPMSWARLQAKFRDCCSYAPALSISDLQSLVRSIEHLEDADDVSLLVPA